MPGNFSIHERDNNIHCWEGSEICDASNTSSETKHYKSELLFQEEVESRSFVWSGNSSELFSHDVLQEISKYTARGYEEPQSDEGCFAATATVQGIRMLLARCLD